MAHETRARVAGELRAVTDDGAHFVTLQAIRPGVVDDLGSLWDPHTFDAYAQTRRPVLCVVNATSLFSRFTARHVKRARSPSGCPV